MPTSIDLQPNMIHSLPVIVLLAVLLFSPVLYWLCRSLVLRRKKRTPVQEEAAPVPVPRPLPAEVRAHYLFCLSDLQRRAAAGEITSKQAYLMLSMLVREFVKAYAGVDVTTRTLEEIQGMGMPMLCGLLQELYEPAFSLCAQGNTEELAAKAKRVIETWN